MNGRVWLGMMYLGWVADTGYIVGSWSAVDCLLVGLFRLLDARPVHHLEENVFKRQIIRIDGYVIRNSRRVRATAA